MSAKPTVSDELRKALEEADAAVVKAEDTSEELAAAEQEDDRKKLDALFEQRQPHLDAVDGFWGTVITCATSPIKEFLNATCDTKIARAITSLSIKRRKVGDDEEGAIVSRTVTIKLKPNMFIESSELSREIDNDHQTRAISGVAWKAGTEKVRNDSFFHKMFTKGAVENDEDPVNMLDALDEIFASPFLVLEEAKSAH